MKRLITLVSALVLVPALALAQPTRTPDEWYKEGETQYNLGNFQGAVDAFKKGFELEPNESKKAAYLYNVAQAYRQAKDCTNAQFFYKRYLSLKDNDVKKPLNPTKRQEIEDRIKELDECAKQQEAIRQKPPGDIRPDEPKADPKPDVKVDPNAKVVGQVGGEGEGEGDGEGGDIHKGAQAEQPKLISVRAFGGGAKINTGDLDVPTQVTFGLIAGYPIAINEKLIIDAGAGFTFTPVPFEANGMSSSAKMIGLVANAGVTYLVTPKIGIRGDVGAGVLFFSGVSESPFTDGQVTTGALSMFHVRVGLSADYAVTPNFLITLMPIAFSYSPAHSGLRDDIKSITALDFMLGLGYRM